MKVLWSIPLSFNGLNNNDAMEKISEYLEKKGWGSG